MDRQLFQARRREDEQTAHVLPSDENNVVRECRNEMTNGAPAR